MNLTKDDLKAIKSLFDDSLDQRVPKIIEKYIEGLKLEIGQFSLETTKRFDSLDAKLSGKIDDLRDGLVETTEIADTNRTEIAKIKRKVGQA